MELFHIFVIIPILEMSFTFIALNTLKSDRNFKGLYEICLLRKNNVIYHKFIKPISTVTSRQNLLEEDSYLNVLQSSSFVDELPKIVEVIGTDILYFRDTLSKKIFLKSFSNLGYPINNFNIKILECSSLRKDVKHFQIKSKGLVSNINERDLVNCCLSMESFFMTLSDEAPLDYLQMKLDACDKSTFGPVDEIPDKPGVYYFLNSENETIYVGKAKRLKRRIKQHLKSKNRKTLKMLSESTSIDFNLTGSNLIALLLEANEIQRLKPKYNTEMINSIAPCMITYKKDAKGIMRLRIEQKTFQDTTTEVLYNRNSAIKEIENLYYKFQLCKRMCGLEKTGGKCSSIGICKGICDKKESVESYNERVNRAISYLEQSHKSFLIRLKGRSDIEDAFVIVEKGIFKGYGYIDKTLHINSLKDLESHINKMKHTYFSARAIDQYVNDKLIKNKTIYYFEENSFLD